MFQKLFKQFQKFSCENWWIYLIFIFALVTVFFTGKGKIWEIMLIFSLNMLGNLYILLMQDSYKDSHFKRGAIFLLVGNILYWIIAIYSAVFNTEYQYLLWQIAFQTSWLKSLLYYHRWWNIKWINQRNMLYLSIGIFLIGGYVFELWLYKLIQSLGFAFTVVWLVQLQDIKRYFLIFFWNIFISIGSGIGLYQNFISGEIFGITVSFTILSVSTFVFYLKLLPEYMRRFKKSY